MKNRFPWLGVAFALMFAASAVPFADEREARLDLPPTSIGEWYKPANKHHVWLHTMFRLRREMQAVTEYSSLGEAELLTKWLDRLAADYMKIGEMVPEWKDELELELLEKMRQAADAGKTEELQRLQGKLAKDSCQSCHREYKAVTALLYRAPDFGPVRVEDSESLEEEPYAQVMNRFTLLVNRIKIASEDGRKDTAKETLDDLERRLADLGESCAACHQDEAPRERILGATAHTPLKALRTAIDKGDAKGAGAALGKFAVNACARCHGIHRLSASMRRLLTPVKQ